MSKNKERWTPVTPTAPPSTGPGVFDLTPQEDEITVTDARAAEVPQQQAAVMPSTQAATPAARRKAAGRKKKHLIGARFEEDMQRQFNDVRAQVMQRYGNKDVRMQEIVAAILHATLKTDEASIDWIVQEMENLKAIELAKSAPRSV